MNRNKLKKFLIVTIILSIISIFILFILGLDYNALKKIRDLNIFFLFLAFSVHILSLIFWSIRIKLMVRLLNEKISLRKSIRIVLVNVFIAAITPSQIGGEPIRVKMLQEEGLKRGNAIGIIITERIIDFMFLMITAPLTLISVGTLIEIGDLMPVIRVASFLLIAAVLLTMLIIIMENKVSHFVCKIIKILVKDSIKREKICKAITLEIKIFSQTTKKLFKSMNFIKILPLTALMWISDLIVPSIILLSMNEKPYWLYSLAIQFILMIIMMLPVTPGGSIIAELGSFTLYSKILPEGTVVILTFLWRIVLFYTNLIIGFIFTIFYLKNYVDK